VIRAAAFLAAQILGSDPQVITRHAAVLFYLDYQACLTNKAGAAGMFNDNPPRAVAEAAQSDCAEQWASFQSAFMDGVDEPSPQDWRSLEYFRSLAIGAASSELVVGRRGSCGTRPGRYQCRALVRQK
jgi:hypothetical protein